MQLVTSFVITVLLAGFLVPKSGLSQVESKDANETIRINRLVSLCKLWGRVKYFHPSLAYRADVDWDATLVAAITKVREAKSSAEYAAAMQGLLNGLGDRSTHVFRNSLSSPTQTDVERPLEYRLTEDGILIITVPDYFALTTPVSQQNLRAIAEKIADAKAIIFDLRTAQPGGDYGNFQLRTVFSQIERHLFSQVLSTPNERKRVHYGYRNDFGFQYKSGFFTQDGEVITPASSAKDRPSIFILNHNSGLLRSTLPLQARGKGLILFEGDPKDVSIDKSQTLSLGEGFSAEIRMTEPVYDDGTSADFQPDRILPLFPGSPDTGITRALELARNFKSSAVIRGRLPAGASPVRERSYPDMKFPSIEYRLLAVFRLWNVINYFYPYKHLMGEDWDALLPDYIRKFEQAKDQLEYSLAVAEMITRIHDSHAYVSGPVLNEYFGTGYPPIRVRMIEGTPVVVALFDVRAKDEGVAVGDIILKVDGEDAHVRLARYAKYISASTSQSGMDKATLGFMNGRVGSLVALTIRDGANRQKVVQLKRRFEDFNTLYHRERSGDIIKVLRGSVGYVDLDRLTQDKIDEMFERLKGTNAIIFDMRGYPNGTGWTIASRLASRPGLPAALFETPVVTPLLEAGGPTTSVDAFYQTIPPRPEGKPAYEGKTVMLIDERAQSQAEHTGLLLRAANGTRLVGSRTSGANGEITSFSVPGGIGIGFTGQSVRFPDGRQLQRIGLIPDIEVKPTIKGIRNGRDEVLDTAMRYFSKAGKKVYRSH